MPQKKLKQPKDVKTPKGLEIDANTQGFIVTHLQHYAEKLDWQAQEAANGGDYDSAAKYAFAAELIREGDDNNSELGGIVALVEGL